LKLAGEHQVNGAVPGTADSGHHDRTPLKQPQRLDAAVGDALLIPVTTTGPH